MMIIIAHLCLFGCVLQDDGVLEEGEGEGAINLSARPSRQTSPLDPDQVRPPPPHFSPVHTSSHLPLISFHLCTPDSLILVWPVFTFLSLSLPLTCAVLIHLCVLPLYTCSHLMLVPINTCRLIPVMVFFPPSAHLFFTCLCLSSTCYLFPLPICTSTHTPVNLSHLPSPMPHTCILFPSHLSPLLSHSLT